MLKIWGLLSLGLSMALLAPRPSPIKSQAPLDFELMQMLGLGTLKHAAGSPDASQLALAGSRGIYLYDVGQNTLTHLEQHPDQLNFVAWSPDNQKLASLSVETDTAYIWNLADNALIRLPDVHSKLIRWSSDSRRLATIEDDRLRIWASDGSLLATLAGQSDLLLDIAWQANSLSTIATASYGNTVQVWDVETGEMKAQLTLTAPVRSIAWNSDGSLLSAATSGDIVIWQPVTQTVLATLAGHTETVYKVFWRDEQLASLGNDKVILWDMTRYSLQSEWGSFPITEWTSDDYFTSVTSAGVFFYDTTTGQSIGTALTGFLPRVDTLIFHPHAPYLISHHGHHSIKLWEMETGQQIADMPLETSHLAWDSHFSRLVTAPMGTTLRIWAWSELLEAVMGEHLPSELAVYIELSSATGHTNSINALAWSPNDTWIASVADDFTAAIWDGDTGERLFTLEHPAQDVIDLAWKPDSQELATIDGSGAIYIWNPRTGQKISEIRDPSDTSFAISLAWHPDGTLLASGSVDGYVRVWDRQDNRLISRIQAHEGQIFALAWRPDGSLLASAGGDGSIHLWDVVTGELIDSLAGHVDEIRALAWRPDGTQLASGGMDGTIHLWGQVQD